VILLREKVVGHRNNRWPRVWVVEDVDGSARSAFFNIESAERWIAERKEPSHWVITPYIPELEPDEEKI
jgi:hypothetical protein